MTVTDEDGETYDVTGIEIDKSCGQRAVKVSRSGAVYYVVDHDRWMECECMGCLRWGYCKHIDMAKQFFKEKA